MGAVLGGMRGGWGLRVIVGSVGYSRSRRGKRNVMIDEPRAKLRYKLKY